MSKAISRTKADKDPRVGNRSRRPAGNRNPPAIVRLAPGPSATPDPMLFDEEHHPEALEHLAVRALEKGDYAAAFRYADRRCRISPPIRTHHYVLRAEASYHLGDRDAAISDIGRALKITPDSRSANQRMLAWGDGPQQIESARSLLRHERDFGVLASAIVRLREAGQQHFAAVEYTDTQINGWAAWRGKSQLKITIADGEAAAATVTVAPDPHHRLRDIVGSAASFVLPRPLSSKPELIVLQVGKQSIFEMRARPNRKASEDADSCGVSHGRFEILDQLAEGSDDAPAALRRLDAKHLFGSPDSRPLTIIVPVYEDYKATRACLESLLLELKSLPQSRAILVDDATPNPRIRDYLDTLSKKRRIKLLRNAHNLGFVHSVNRALQEAGRSDVLLLNADTILPPGCIIRLCSAAYSAPKIGTVTPFSNNGEIMSFPVANLPNPLGTPEEIASLDAAAATANMGRVVDIPNGIGFCLYVTRDCLDAVGPLSDIYYRGYFEDVDLCLRAREHGFRNVCAASIYVGHAGALSFGAERQSLIMQNLAVLEQRFLKYRAECAAYLLADPLRQGRAAIERALPPSRTGGRLLITGMGAVKAVVEARSQNLMAEGIASLILEVHLQPPGPRVYFVDPSKGIPQSLMFKLDVPEERAALAAYFVRVKPSCIEIADPAHTPPTLLDLLHTLDVPIDLLITDAGLACRRGSFLRDDGSTCNALASGTACQDCIDAGSEELGARTEPIETWRTRWREIAARANHILAPCARARDFARHFLVDLPVTELHQPRNIAAMDGGDVSSQENLGLGFVAVGDNGGDYHLIEDVARALRRDHPGLSIVVIGRTLSDLALMRNGNVFVTGAVEPGHYRQLLRRYRLNALFAASRRPLFGHPAITEIADSGLPIAFFDWSFGRSPVKPGNLALDPRAANDAVASEMAAWLTSPKAGKAKRRPAARNRRSRSKPTGRLFAP